jgi:surface protein
MDFNGDITSCYHMFAGCTHLTLIDLSNFNTSKITDMSYMFGSCQKIVSLDLSNFDTSAVTNMERMFSGCLKLTSLTLEPRTTTYTGITTSMFNSITTTGVLKIPAGTKDYWANVIAVLPSTWTVEVEGEEECEHYCKLDEYDLL